MSATRTRNLNSMLIEVVSKYQEITKNLDEMLDKFDISSVKDEKEIQELFALHRLYVDRLKEVAGLLKMLQHEFSIQFTDTIH